MSTSRKMARSKEAEVPDGSQEQPILVFEDHDVPQSGIGFEVEKLVRQVQKGDARFNPIDLDGEDENLSEDPWRADEDSYDTENAKIEHEELANEPEDTKDGPCVHWKKGIRNPCPCGTHQKVPKVTISSTEISESQVVELKESVRVGRYEAEFVEVHEIWVPYKGDQSFIRGRTYARTRNLEGRIEPRQNEVCEIYELDENDHRATNPVKYLESALVEVPILNVKTIRTLHKTNKAFPECRFDRVRYRAKEERDDEAPLTCRWQMVLSYPDPRYRRQQRPIAGEVIRHYSQNDIPKDRHRVPDSERRKAHEKIRGGSFVPNGAPEADPAASPIHLAPGQKYTVVDIFSGAGGYSKGAEMAGLKVLAACDHWPWCCETYRQNFPDADLHQEDVYKFIDDLSTDLTREDYDVDILHFSPPCQTWSPAHTCEGKKDEENRATLFACEKIITIFHPRIFTVEQTFGLAQDRWIPNFNALLQGFTRHGYSVKWKVLHLVEYGLPQTRKRLVMVGAAPGEQLPAWPRPTHSKDPKDGQKPFVSAHDVCGVLVEGESLHDVDGARPAAKIPWDSSKPLRWTITTSAGQCHHWSGQRGFTLAELAVLQGFPTSFRFVGKCIKKQIGNAFPPVVVKTLLKSIRVHLEIFDGVTRQPPPGQIIIVSDDDNENHDNNEPQMRYNDHGQSQAESQMVVEDLVGFGKKPSKLSQELLQGVIEDVRENPIQCFLAKAGRKSSKDDTSSGPSPQRSIRGGTRQPQPTQRNTINSYFLPANNQDSSTAANTRVGGDSSVAPQDTADSALVAAEDDNSATQDVTAGTSSAPFQIPSTSDENTAAQTGIAGQTTGTGRTINAGIISAPPSQSFPDPDEPRARRSAQTAVTIADLHSPVRQNRSSTSQTIVGGVLSAPPQDSSDSETDRPMARRSVSNATPEQSPGTGREIDSVVVAPTAPRRQGRPGNRDAALRHGTPAPQNGRFEGAVSSATRQAGIRAALANSSQDAQAGPSRRRSSGDSIACLGGSSRAGARPSLPIVVEDDEEQADADGDEEEDEDQQLQRAIKMSMAGAPRAEDTRGEVDRQGFDLGETALAFQRSILETRRSSHGHETENLYGAKDNDDDPAPERDMYGAGDHEDKGKGKEVAPRTFDEYAEDEGTQKEGGPNKRPRGSK
ncbi:putative rip defective [Diaporthe ampelina]|uniref:DNA (cytosine-5-)-methyltransferase n=1 Tax=Diaporthe ampelina TaxID=1214573 RepID=A0A0G2FXW6_9PEZI|nr:putative rip defective [Diaporthe ampelina]